MRSRSTAVLAAVLALAFPAVLLQASPGAQAAAPVVLYDQTANAATPSADPGAPNFSPSNDFGGDTDRTADDFVVPAGATWAISEIGVAGAFEAPTTESTVNVYLYADAAGKPGNQIFSQLAVVATGAPNFVVPLTGAPALTAGTYWVTVQFIVDGGPFWSWGTSTVQRGNPAHWTGLEGPAECQAGWAVRTVCWAGTNPDQVFVLKGTDLTPSNDVELGKPVRNKKTGTATLPVTVPGGGTLALAGRNVAPRQLVAAGAGKLKLKVKATGPAKAKLKETGKVTVKVKVTFTPTGGVAKTVTKKVKLRKDLD